MSEHYRVADDGALSDGCSHCGHGRMWTIVSGHGDDEIAISTSWNDKGLAEDICNLMNDAYDAGRNSDPAVNREEAKLVAWFRNEGKQLGDEGDYNNWTPAETAIYAMRKLLAIPRKSRGLLSGFTPD